MPYVPGFSNSIRDRTCEKAYLGTINYSDNLLPDSEPIRTRLATRSRTASVEAFDLLQAIGRDCVGAI